jgi:hypothetical protein
LSFWLLLVVLVEVEPLRLIGQVAVVVLVVIALLLLVQLRVVEHQQKR